MTRRLFRIAGAIAAGLLAVGVIALAGPTVIWELIRGTALGTLVGAAGIAAIGAVCRGARLSFVLPPQILGIAQATSVGVAAQAAALFIPARIGELALPWLLRRQCKVPFPSGIGTLIATRSLDLAALSVWGGVALILLDHTNPLLWICAIVLLLPALLIQPIFRVLDRCSVRLLG
ncbi:MAG: hypothetical protein GY906_28240, partial [bacterium]|nr:hypothetical protein [bacterium]